MTSRIWKHLRGHVGCRWVGWVVLLLTACVLGVLLLPVFRKNPEVVHNYFSSVPVWQRGLANFAATVAVLFILFRLFSPRITHLTHFRLHPPFWSAWAAAAVILCVMDLTSGLGPQGFRAEWWEWLLYGGGALLFVLVSKRFTRAPEKEPEVAADVPATSLDDMLRDWATLDRWLWSERPADEDLIGNRRIARRLAVHLVTHGGSIGLVGPFGSGKSSVVRWLMEEVKNAHQKGQPELWFCEQSCWGFEDSASAVQQILSRAIETISRNVDCFSTRSLPESYRKTFAAGGDWVRTLADLVLGSADPLEQFRYLADILVGINARLVIVVEDLDRNTSSRFDRQEVLALLQRLRISNRFSFVLATGQSSARDIDFAKLCDHIEILRDFDPSRVDALVNALRSQCFNSSSHIQTAPADDNPWSASRYLLLSRFDYVSPSEAAARLLRTPRALKHALRRTYRAWGVLVGEVDFDHLLAVNILRFGAPEAFDFMLRYWDQLHVDPNRLQSNRDQVTAIRERLTAEWCRVIRDVEWDTHSAQAILVFLLPQAGEYVGAQRGLGDTRLQGIGHRRYWLRIVNEELDEAEERDQTVLRDLYEWRTTRNAESALIDALIAREDYAFVWQYYAPAVIGSDPSLILQLASQVLARHRTPYGARTPSQRQHSILGDMSLPSVAFGNVRRYANRWIVRNEVARDWLAKEIRLAMPVSLSLVNDLYYYWGSANNGIIRPEDRPVLRRLIYDLARQHIRNGDDLIRLSHPEVPYGIYQLVFPPNDEDGESELRGIEHWRWLGPIILDALRCEPRRFAIQVAYLISVTRRDAYVGTAFVVPERLSGLFSTDASEVMGLLAAQQDQMEGRDGEYLRQVVRSQAEPPTAPDTQPI